MCLLGGKEISDTGKTKRNVAEIRSEQKKKNVCSVTSFQLKMLHISHLPLLGLTSAA